MNLFAFVKLKKGNILHGKHIHQVKSIAVTLNHIKTSNSMNSNPSKNYVPLQNPSRCVQNSNEKMKHPLQIQN